MALCRHKLLEIDISGAHRCIDCDAVFNVGDEIVNTQVHTTTDTAEQTTTKKTYLPYLVAPVAAIAIWTAGSLWEKMKNPEPPKVVEIVETPKPEVRVVEKPVVKVVEKPVVQWKTRTVYRDRPKPKPKPAQKKPVSVIARGPCSKEDVLAVMLKLSRADLDAVFGDYRLDDSMRETWNDELKRQTDVLLRKKLSEAGLEDSDEGLDDGEEWSDE